MAAPEGAGALSTAASLGQQGCASSGSLRSVGSAASAGQGSGPERAPPWEPPGTPPHALPAAACRGSPGCENNPAGLRVRTPARDADLARPQGHLRPGQEDRAGSGPDGRDIGPNQAASLEQLLQAEESLRSGRPQDLKPADAMGSPFWLACCTQLRAGGDAGSVLAPSAMLQAREDGLPRAVQCGSTALASEHSKVRGGAGFALQRRARGTCADSADRGAVSCGCSGTSYR